MINRRTLQATPLMLLLLLPLAVSADDPLPSWKEGPSRSAIVDFVNRVTEAESPHHVPPEERIAVFDNDGTLWAEQPMYFQLLFTLDRVKAMAPGNPQWQTLQPFASVLAGKPEAALAGGTQAILELVMATHSGMTATEFDAAARQWLAQARHPTTGRSYTAMVYQPMLELLRFLRANGFSTYIVSGGGIDFMRPWTEEVYGIPPQQVVGSSLEVRYTAEGGAPRLQREAKMNFIDDKAGKPVGIHRHIGRRPIMAVGNSDGDFEMLEWTTAGDGARLGVLIHHTDAEREWAYDRESHIGQLKRGLDEAGDRGWVVVDMKNEWAQIFPPAD